MEGMWLGYSESKNVVETGRWASTRPRRRRRTTCGTRLRARLARLV